MKTKVFERELPENYKQTKHINATDKKLGIILNIIAFAVFFAVIVLALLTLYLSGEELHVETADFFIGWLVFMVSLVAYFVLHELVHGIAYKLMTKEKLTFGLTWSCAYCGVPSIYTYRRTALISLASPLIVFSLILFPLTAFLYFVSPLYFLISAIILGLHLGGCSGDIYCIILFSFKFKDKRTLMRDTGPEQFFYLPED